VSYSELVHYAGMLDTAAYWNKHYRHWLQTQCTGHGQLLFISVYVRLLSCMQTVSMCCCLLWQQAVENACQFSMWLPVYGAVTAESVRYGDRLCRGGSLLYR